MVLHDHQGAVDAVAFASGGKQLASGSSDETIRLWDVESQTVTHTLRGHASGVSAIAYSSNNSQLFSGAMDGPVRIWNLSPQ